jgi:hypothetical protein
VSVQEVLRAVGQWNLQLTPDAPPGVVSALDYFGHVAIVPGRVNPVERGDDMLTLARYVGILRSIEGSEQVTLSGPGMAAWLGDEDGKGDVIETPGVSLTGATFPQAIRAVLPAHGAITEGTLYTGIPGTLTNLFMYVTPRSAIDYICDTMRNGASWRVNGNGTLDAGPASSLFRTTPTCMIVRKGAGYDTALKALPGALDTTLDAKEYSSRIVLVAAALAGGTADAGVVPYRDIHGNTVHITRVIDEQDDTLLANAPARAQTALDTYNGIRRSVQLSTGEFDIRGDFAPGDRVWVYDPDNGLSDPATEVEFRGRVLNPAAVQVLSVTWPVERGYTVGYRHGDGTWTDLTPWVDWEAPGGGQVEVADALAPALTSSVGSGGGMLVAGAASIGDSAVPGTPVFGTFTTSSYQPVDGLARSAVRLTWSQPTNTDGSTITDGDHYEIQYRPTGTTTWQVVMVAFDSTATTITNLPPGTSFDWQIRAVDYATPTNYGAWSATTVFSTSSDVTPPATPAAPSVAASLIAVQVTHTLGAATGGTYNLAIDLDHLEVHVSTTGSFTPSAATLVGKLPANAGMLQAGIPAVGTFQVDTLVPAGSTAYVRVVAVDKTGNRSTASAAASSTASLIDNAHISDLTVSKLTAGTLAAAVILSGSIKTATSGARMETDASGLRLYNGSGVQTVGLDATTGNATLTGTLLTQSSGRRIQIDSTGNGTIWFYPTTGSDYAFINSPLSNSVGVNSGNGGTANGSRVYVTPSAGELNFINVSSQAQVGGRVSVGSTSGQMDYPSGGFVTVTSSSAYLGMTSGAQAYVASTYGILTAYNGGTTYSQFEADNDGSIYMKSYGGANYAIVGVPGSTYLQLSGSTVDLWSAGTSGINITTTTITATSTAFKVTSLKSSSTTSSFSANVYVDSTTGQLYRAISAAKSKVAIATAVLDHDAVLQLRPVTYLDRRQWDLAGGDATKCSPQLGVIAEEVAALPGIGALLTETGEDGQVAAVNYERLAVALLAVVRDHAGRLADLEGKPARRPKPWREPSYRDGKPQPRTDEGDVLPPGPRNPSRDAPARGPVKAAAAPSPRGEVQRHPDHADGIPA